MSKYAKQRLTVRKQLVSSLVSRIVEVGPDASDPIDAENFQTALSFTLDNLSDHPFLDIRPKQCQLEYDNLIEVLKIRAHFTKASALEELLSLFHKQYEPLMDEEQRFGILKILFILCHSPVNAEWNESEYVTRRALLFASETDKSEEIKETDSRREEVPDTYLEDWNNEWDKYGNDSSYESSDEEIEQPSLVEHAVKPVSKPNLYPVPDNTPPQQHKQLPVKLDSDFWKSSQFSKPATSSMKHPNGLADAYEKSCRTTNKYPLYSPWPQKTITEREAVREVLAMLNGISGDIFAKKETKVEGDKSEFVCISDVQVSHLTPGSLKHVFDKFMTIANAIESVSAHSSRALSNDGTVTQSFGDVIRRYLHDVLRAQLQHIEGIWRKRAFSHTETSDSHNVTLIQLLHTIQPRFSEILAIQSVISEAMIFEAKENEKMPETGPLTDAHISARLLSVLYSKLQDSSIISSEDRFRLFLALFLPVLESYCESISSCLVTGVVRTNEFGVTSLSGTSANLTTSEYWSQAFALRLPAAVCDVNKRVFLQSAWPDFIPSISQRQTLISGKSLNLAQQMDRQSGTTRLTEEDAWWSGDPGLDHRSLLYKTVITRMHDFIAISADEEVVVETISKEPEVSVEVISRDVSPLDSVKSSDSDSEIEFNLAKKSSEEAPIRPKFQDDAWKMSVAGPLFSASSLVPSVKTADFDEKDRVNINSVLWDIPSFPVEGENSVPVQTAAKPVTEKNGSIDVTFDFHEAVNMLCPEVSNIYPNVCRKERILNLRDLIKYSLLEPIRDRYRWISPLLVESLKKPPLQLPLHLHVLRSFLLMGAGGILHSWLHDSVFPRIDKDEHWFHPRVLGTGLHEAITNELGYEEDVIEKSVENSNWAISSRFVISKGLDSILVNPGSESDQVVSSDRNSVHATDCLSLSYDVPWPLDIILDVNAMSEYSRIFSFLVSLARARYVLETTTSFRRDPSDTFVHRFHLLRLKLIQFVINLNDYVRSRVIDDEWRNLLGSLDSLQDVDQVIAAHSRYLRHIRDRCLLGPTSLSLAKAMFKILDICIQFSTLYRSYIDALTSADESTKQTKVQIINSVRNLDIEYTKNHKLLLTVLEMLAQNKGVQVLSGLADLYIRLNFSDFYSQNILDV